MAAVVDYEAIRILLAERVRARVPASDIAAEFGVSIEYLRQIAHRCGVSLRPDKMHRWWLRARVDMRTYRTMKIEAERRGMTSDELAAHILTVVARDLLFAAVIDEGGK